MISKGKRRYLKKLISNCLWNRLPKGEQERIMQEHLTRMMKSVSIDYGVPMHMLYGMSRVEYEGTLS